MKKLFLHTALIILTIAPTTGHAAVACIPNTFGTDSSNNSRGPRKLAMGDSETELEIQGFFSSDSCTEYTYTTTKENLTVIPTYLANYQTFCWCRLLSPMLSRYICVGAVNMEGSTSGTSRCSQICGHLMNSDTTFQNTILGTATINPYSYPNVPDSGY